MAKVYLSRRNLLTFLSKLDRVKAGHESKCTLEKNDYLHLRFPQTMKKIAVVAVEDADSYSPRPTCQVHLSRQSILTLLSHLDMIKTGRSAACTVQVDNLDVMSVEDADYYANRPAGPVLPIDDPNPDPLLKWRH